MRLRYILGLLVFALVGADAAACGPVRSLFAHIRERRSQPAPMAIAPVAPTPLTFTAPVPGVVGAAPTAVLREKHRALAEVVREHAVRHLVREGYQGQRLTRAEARELVDKIPDETIAAAGQSYGVPVGDGGPLANFFQWLVDHKDVIMKIVQFILMLLPLFADSEPAIGWTIASESPGFPPYQVEEPLWLLAG